MPSLKSYTLACGCGFAGEVFAYTDEIFVDEGGYTQVACPDCDAVQRPQTPRFRINQGDLEGRPIHAQQLGRTFKNSKDMDAYCKQNGLVVDTAGSAGFRKFKDDAREAAEEMYREAGYRDKDDFQRRSRNREEMAERVQAAREQKAKTPSNIRVEHTPALTP